MKRSTLSFFSALVFSGLMAQAEVTPLSGASKMSFDQLPAAVQAKAKAQAGSAAIEDVEKGMLHGKMVYEIAYKQNGQHVEARLAEDGSVVDTIVAGQSTGSASQATASSTSETKVTEPAGAPAPTPPSAPAFDAGFGATLSGASKISWDQVPDSVQRIIREQAGSAKIEDIDRGRVGKNVVYQAAYKKNGQHTELRVLEDGRFREVSGGITIGSSDKSLIGFGNSLGNATAISWEEVPPAVREATKSRLGNVKAQSIRKGTINGTTFYQFAFQRSGHGELRVSSDGKFVREVVNGKMTYQTPEP